MSEEDKNPFSFKSFLTEGHQKSSTSRKEQNVKSTKQETSFEATDKDEDNPFSFKNLFPVKNKDTESDLSQKLADTVSVPNSGTTSSLFEDTEDVFNQLPSPNKLIDLPEINDIDVLSKTSIIDESLDIENNTLPVSEFVSYDDFEENTAELDTVLTTDNILMQALSEVKEENKKLKVKLKDAREKTQEKSEKVTELLGRITALEKKELEETSALEEIIQQVEANLKTTTERSLLAEKKNERLTREVKTLQDKIDNLSEENQLLHLKEKSNIPQCQIQYVSQQLGTAAKSAEQQLKQLLGGVENLKQLSEILLSVDRFTEVPDEQGASAT